MRYRLVALDLDGTIVDSSLQVDPRDAQAVGRAVEAGVHVVACSGRPFPAALPWAHHLALQDPLVCYQGAQVRGLDGAMLLDHGVPHELAMEVVNFCRPRNLHVQGYRDDELLVERDRPEARHYSRVSGMPFHVVPDLNEALGATTPKVVVVAAKDKIERLLPEFRRRWGKRLTITTSLPEYLEITSLEADKAKAITFLAERLAVSAGETVALGDGRNDAPMLDWAGLGVAVEGAAPEVLEVADRVIAPPGSGAIAELFEELGLGSKPTPVRQS